MSDGMNTVILMNTVLGYECSVDDAITIETMMFKNMRTEINRLTAELAAEKKFSQDCIDEIEELHLELARYKQGVEVRDFVNHYGILENEFELHSHLRDKRVRVLVMKVEVGG